MISNVYFDINIADAAEEKACNLTVTLNNINNHPKLQKIVSIFVLALTVLLAT